MLDGDKTRLPTEQQLAQELAKTKAPLEKRRAVPSREPDTAAEAGEREAD